MTRNYACEAFCSVDDIYDASCGCDLNVDTDDIFVQAMIDQASDILSLATGGVVSGRCTVTVRPVRLCWDGPWYDPSYYNEGWRRRFGGLDTIPLRGPNTDIVEILIDGAVINPSDYGLVDNHYLFRRSTCWPTYNDLTKASTQVNTFEITYRFGKPVDQLTKMACIELTCELIKDSLGKKSSLPRGTTQANIQGVQIQVRDRAEALRAGDEQIPVVSRFLSVYATDGLNMVSSVWSPELEQRWNLIEVEGPSGS